VSRRHKKAAHGDHHVARLVSAEGERFFVAAFADEKAASALADRIRQQLKRRRHGEQTGWTLSVSYRMLHVVPADAGATKDDLVASMAGNLDEAATSHIDSEAVVS
jgi:GGDEF domain-containing protein